MFMFALTFIIAVFMTFTFNKVDVKGKTYDFTAMD